MPARADGARARACATRFSKTLRARVIMMIHTRLLIQFRTTQQHHHHLCAGVAKAWGGGRLAAVRSTIHQHILLLTAPRCAHVYVQGLWGSHKTMRLC